MFRPRVIVWLLGLAALVGTAAGAGWILNHAEEGSAPGTPTSPVADPPGLGIVALGYVDSEPRIADLYPAQTGEVVQLVSEGQTVHQGDVLLQLDDRLAQQDLKRAQRDLEGSKLQLTKAKLLPRLQQERLAQTRAGLEAAQQEKEAAEQDLAIKESFYKDGQINVQTLRMSKALVQKAIAMVEVAQARKRELEVSQPQLDIDRAAVEVSEKQAVVVKAELALDRYKVRAPLDGTVLRVLTAKGEVLGSHPHSAAIQFCPKGKRIIRAEVQQEWARNVKTGQDAVIEDDTTAGTKWSGRVMQVSDWYTHRRSILQEPFQLNDVRTIECLVEVTSPPGSEPLRLGQRVRVTIKQGGP
jgi:multidrug resistance efflux pump